MLCHIGHRHYKATVKVHVLRSQLFCSSRPRICRPSASRDFGHGYRDLFSINLSPFSSSHPHSTDDISLLLNLCLLPLDELFGSLVVHKLSLTWVLCAFASGPDLVFKATLLAFLVRKSAVRVEAGVESALGLDVSEFAVGICAASAVSTERH